MVAVADGKTGLLFEADDLQELGSMLHLMLGNSKIRQRVLNEHAYARRAEPIARNH